MFARVKLTYLTTVYSIVARLQENIPNKFDFSFLHEMTLFIAWNYIIKYKSGFFLLHENPVFTHQYIFKYKEF